MEDIKLSIAKRDGFDDWEMMIKCYERTDAGLKVIDENKKKAFHMYSIIDVLTKYEKFASGDNYIGNKEFIDQQIKYFIDSHYL